MNLQTDVTSGPSDVVASGTVIAFAGNPIQITLGPLRFQFEFVTDTATQQHNIHATTSEGNTLRLQLTNFENPLGTGSTKPMPLGTLAVNGRNRVLHLHFRVYGIGGGADKTLQYTFYVGEDAR